MSLLSKAWKTYRWLRVGTAISGTLGGTGSIGGLWIWRRAQERMAEAPEFAVPNVTVGQVAVDDAQSGGFQMPQLSAIPWDLLAGVVLVLLALFVLARAPMPRPENPFDTDSRRLFSDEDRRWIDKATKGRCEHRSALWLWRCRGTAQQLDHWYPWSLGGATSHRNLVNLCARHNGRKSNKVPTWLDTVVIRAVRRWYFQVPQPPLDGLMDAPED